MIRMVLSLVLGVGLPSLASACIFDTDCEIGSRCLKPRGALHGVCAGGLEPGRPAWSEVEPDPLELDPGHGVGCRFDTDCGPGLRCAKEPASARGVCMSLDFERRLIRDSAGWSREPHEERRTRPCLSRFDCGFGELCLSRRGFGPGRCMKSR
ncbi:MAG: hypothetical protein KatS3mg125_1023 [Lysobacterales bacterium]|jgi:hypothetical protein|nr:MAG: hypothetical protein KatS3mg125_1023 [Xanthomonadales bacterium]